MVRINEMEELQMDNMESRAFVIKSESNPRIRIEAVPGHFVTQPFPHQLLPEYYPSQA